MVGGRSFVATKEDSIFPLPSSFGCVRGVAQEAPGTGAGLMIGDVGLLGNFAFFFGRYSNFGGCVGWR